MQEPARHMESNRAHNSLSALALNLAITKYNTLDPALIAVVLRDNSGFLRDPYRRLII